MIKAKPEKIRELAEDRNLNIIQLAEKLGVARQSLYRIMSGGAVGSTMVSAILEFSGGKFEDFFYVENSKKF